MAVCTPDDTLFDLGRDSSPGRSSLEEDRHVGQLVGSLAVVELQHHGVALAAIDTGMCAQVGT
jgi:hypothetical protein